MNEKSKVIIWKILTLFVLKHRFIENLNIFGRQIKQLSILYAMGCQKVLILEWTVKHFFIFLQKLQLLKIQRFVSILAVNVS